MKKLNVLCVANKKYINPMKVFLYSLFEHHEIPVDVYVLHADIDDETLENLEKYCRHWQEKRLIPMQVNLDELTDLYATADFPTEVYLKLLCADILPDEVKKVLCLDLDMVVNKSLETLYETDITGYPLAACKDIYGYIYGEGTRNHARLGLGSRYTYFNAGMMLLNLEYMRDGGWGWRMLEFARRNRDCLKWLEQDVMNCFWVDKYLQVNWHEYNCPPVMYVMKPSDVAAGKIAPLYQADLPGIASFEEYADYTLALCDNASIIHYIGETKPWNVNRAQSNTYAIFDRYYNCYEKAAEDIWGKSV